MSDVARWEHFPHQSDVGVRGIGASLAEALAQAALALTAIVTEIERVRAAAAVEIRCRASDPEMLLVEWLDAVIYEMATRRMLFSRYDVRVAGHALEATAWGEPVDVARHEPAVEVKAATMSALRVAPRDGLWTAECVVDV